VVSMDWFTGNHHKYRENHGKNHGFL
jgi:hypothetical protein